MVAAAVGGVYALTDDDIREMVDDYNKLAVGFCNAEVQASWNVETNVGDEEMEFIQVRQSLVCK